MTIFSLLLFKSINIDTCIRIAKQLSYPNQSYTYNKALCPKAQWNTFIFTHINVYTFLRLTYCNYEIRSYKKMVVLMWKASTSQLFNCNFKYQATFFDEFWKGGHALSQQLAPQKIDYNTFSMEVLPFKRQCQNECTMPISNFFKVLSWKIHVYAFDQRSFG